MSLTTENIYYRHEDECRVWIHDTQITFSPSICDLDYTQDLMKKLNIKHYIKVGEPCSICYEPIKNKKNAFLTNCGHSFHTSCLYKYEYIKTKDIYCPVCRQEMGYWYIDGKFKYPNTQKKNYIDRIEDFWTYKDIVEPLNFSEWNTPYLYRGYRKTICPFFAYGEWLWE